MGHFGNFNLPDHMQPAETSEQEEQNQSEDQQRDPADVPPAAVPPQQQNELPPQEIQQTAPPISQPVPDFNIDPMEAQFTTPLASHTPPITPPAPEPPAVPNVELPAPPPQFSAPAPPPAMQEAPAPPTPEQTQPLELEAPPSAEFQQAAPEPAVETKSEPEPKEAAPPDPAKESQAMASPQPQKRPMRIGEKLIELGLISKDQLQVALQEQKQKKKLLGAILVDMGFITESALGEILAESAGAKRFDIKSTMLDASLIKKIPKELALRHKMLPVGLKGNVLQIAMPDVYNVLAIDQAKRYFDRNTQIEAVYSSESEVLDLIDRYYDYELSIDGILREIETGVREQGNQLSGEEEGYVNPTVRLVDAILADSIKMGASDIHFEPEGQFLRLRYRIDGDLVQIRSFHRNYWAAISVRIKIISNMNIAETRMPQDGRIAFQISGREVDFRVATQPTVHGENIVMRLLDKTKSLVELNKLGFSHHNITLLKKLLKRPEGIIIVTGPTGSGKTTTLYSILSYINSMDVNIMTLEDPVEYKLPLIRQTNVREGTVDFSNGIKSLMRQDPDIIFIGEVRDEDTALMAVRAALTGHQVFTTLHTNDALGAIPRLGDIGVPGHLLAGSLICSLAQRLARRLCDSCKTERLATAEEARLLGFQADQPPMIYQAVGCRECRNTGYKGRIAIIEILRIDDGMNELIATNRTRNTIMEYALNSGFITMVEDGIDKVLQGYIDVDQLVSTIDMTDRM